MRPDPERLRPLKELEPPCNAAAFKRTLGMFSYYSQWIPKFSDLFRPLVSANEFPLPYYAMNAFHSINKAIELSVVNIIDPNIPLVVETDASECAKAATLNQAGRPVAFFSRTLSKSEQNWSTVEKEASAIVEAIMK
jgi:hypothetical protein